MEALENLDAAVRRALQEHPPGKVLACVTGIFVGLTVELCRREGADVGKDITIDGGPNRDITIHAPKAPALAAQSQEDGGHHA